MAATLFFCDGRIAEFPDATQAERRDGDFYVLRYSPRLMFERLATFPADDVAIALVHTGETRQANAAPAADALTAVPTSRRASGVP